MKRLLLVLLFLAAACGPVYAAQVQFSWLANPTTEPVTAYVLLDAGQQIWSGPGTTATVELAPGTHAVTVKACGEWTNQDGTKSVDCSGESMPPVFGTVLSGVKGVRVSVSTSTVTIGP